MTLPPDTPRNRSLMAAVNVEIDRLHSSFELADSDFFCECGEATCRERVTIGRSEFAAMLAEGRPVIAPIHGERDAPADAELLELRGKVQQLRRAVGSRGAIEQAKGLLAGRGDMSLSDAFEVLRHRARVQQRSLDEVCAEFVDGVGSVEDEASSLEASSLRPAADAESQPGSKRV